MAREARTDDKRIDADVLVIFGITGDLAKVMTFRSLYRLERRGLLDCPIVGVAVDDWSVEQLKSALATTGSDAIDDAPVTRQGGGVIDLPLADVPLLFASPTSVTFGLVRHGTSASRTSCATSLVITDAMCGMLSSMKRRFAPIRRATCTCGS